MKADTLSTLLFLHCHVDKWNPVVINQVHRNYLKEKDNEIEGLEVVNDDSDESEHIPDSDSEFNYDN